MRFGWVEYFSVEYMLVATMESKDADGSGTLHVSELVHGLLKIRGDIKSHGCLETSRFWICFATFLFLEKGRRGGKMDR